MTRSETSQRTEFHRWVRETPGFDKCTLEQAVGAYVSTYPGRTLPLLIEMLKPQDQMHPSKQNALETIDRYVMQGCPPGSQIYAMLTNNLRETFAAADEERRTFVFDIVCHLYNNVPGSCWGSEDKVNAWLRMDPAERAAHLGHFKPAVLRPMGADLPEGETR